MNKLRLHTLPFIDVTHIVLSSSAQSIKKPCSFALIPLELEDTR